jgi:Fe-S-cluster-containing dehydrogenase component
VIWVKWKLISAHLKIVLILTQDSCMVCTECAIDSEIVLGVPDGTPRSHGSSGSLFWFIWRLLILAQDRCMVCADCARAWKSFWPHPMELVGNVGQMEAHFSLFGDNVNLDAR